jgi:hypothetical protein
MDQTYLIETHQVLSQLLISSNFERLPGTCHLPSQTITDERSAGNTKYGHLTQMWYSAFCLKALSAPLQVPYYFIHIILLREHIRPFFKVAQFLKKKP